MTPPFQTCFHRDYLVVLLVLDFILKKLDKKLLEFTRISSFC